MKMAVPHELLTVCMGFGGALLLILMTVTVENLLLRRAHGLRRRRGTLLSTAVLADVLKLLSKSPIAPGPRRGLAVVAVLLPAVLLVGGLPVGSGLGGLSATITPADRWLALAGILAVAPLPLLAFAATTTPIRRLPLAAVVITLVGAHAVLVFCIAAVLLAGDAGTDIAARSLHNWPLWHHPTGGLAFLGALAIISSGLRISFGGPGPVRMPAGMVDGPGVSAVLLYMSRPLLIGGAAALAAHLYLGTTAEAYGLIWACVAVCVTLVVVLQAAIGAPDPEGLSRLLWRQVVPLAVIDVAWSVLRAAGVGPWN